MTFLFLVGQKKLSRYNEILSRDNEITFLFLAGQKKLSCENEFTFLVFGRAKKNYLVITR